MRVAKGEYNVKKVVGIRFRQTCKIYYFDPLETELVPGDHVIVETARGMEYGTVSIGTRSIPEEQIKTPLKPIIRKATAEDDETVVQNQVREKEAFNICERIFILNIVVKILYPKRIFELLLIHIQNLYQKKVRICL